MEAQCAGLLQTEISVCINTARTTIVVDTLSVLVYKNYMP